MLTLAAISQRNTLPGHASTSLARDVVPVTTCQLCRHNVEPIVHRALPVGGYLELRGRTARAGVAAFAITLLVPTMLFGATRATRATGDVFVADANEINPLEAAHAEPALPDQIVGAERRFATPEPSSLPAPVAPPAPAAVVTGGAGLLVTASWYGPGFYENRLPCWQWLKANGLPIQFLPDTWGVAHRTLPCGTMLVLTHGRNTVTVPVVDRGPYVAGREIDMSPLIKAALGCTDLCTVLMQFR